MQKLQKAFIENKTKLNKEIMGIEEINKIGNTKVIQNIHFHLGSLKQLTKWKTLLSLFNKLVEAISVKRGHHYKFFKH